MPQPPRPARRAARGVRSVAVLLALAAAAAVARLPRAAAQAVPEGVGAMSPHDREPFMREARRHAAAAAAALEPKDRAAGESAARAAVDALLPLLADPETSDVVAWRVAGRAAEQLGDAELAAFTYEALTRLWDNPQGDPVAAGLPARLQRLQIAERAKRIPADRVAFEVAQQRVVGVNALGNTAAARDAVRATARDLAHAYLVGAGVVPNPWAARRYGWTTATDPVPLGSAANARVNHMPAPTGRVTLGGVPFDFPADGNNAIHTADAADVGLPTRARIDAPADDPVAVHLLVGATYLLPRHRGKTIATVTLVYADGKGVSVPVVVGESVRETWDFDQGGNWGPMEPPAAPGVRWRNVLAVPQHRGRPATAFLDLMTIRVGPQGWRRNLRAIQIEDRSAEFEGWNDPGLWVFGVSIERVVPVVAPATGPTTAPAATAPVAQRPPQRPFDDQRLGGGGEAVAFARVKGTGPETIEDRVTCDFGRKPGEDAVWSQAFAEEGFGPGKLDRIVSPMRGWALLATAEGPNRARLKWNIYENRYGRQWTVAVTRPDGTSATYVYPPPPPPPPLPPPLP
jgi:hypothetical protein